MKTWQSSSLEVSFNVEGEEALKKVNIGHLIEEANEEAIITFGKMLNQLSPETQRLNHSVVVTKTMISE